MKAPKNNLSLILKGFIVAFLIILILFFVLYFNSFTKQNEDNSEIVKIPETAVKVSILNGCGFPGIATEVKEKLLEKENIDVIAWKNNTRDMFIYKQTIIVAKHHEPKKLDYLMNVTGIPFRAYAFNENSIEEFYIILGNDYKKYFN